MAFAHENEVTHITTQPLKKIQGTARYESFYHKLISLSVILATPPAWSSAQDVAETLGMDQRRFHGSVHASKRSLGRLGT